jgi:hypothetical protein
VIDAKIIDTPSMGEYLHYVDFYDVNINPIPCNYKAFVQRGRHSGISMGIRLYIVNLCIDNINEIARGIIHELTHKILMTEDEINDTQPIYEAELCRKLTFSDPDLAVTILWHVRRIYPSGTMSTANSSLVLRINKGNKCCPIL